MWVDDFAAAIARARRGGYVGFVDETDEAAVRRAYPAETYARLAAVKAHVRPDQPLPAQPQHPARRG